MKPIIKGLSMSVLAISFLLPSNVSLADENITPSQTENTGASLDAAFLETDEGKKIIEIGKEKAEKAWEQEKKKQKMNRLRQPNEKYYLNATHFEQSDWYYCGPASGQEVLSFHKRDSGSDFTLPTQKHLASVMGTTSAGTNSANLAWGLNLYKQDYDFADSPYGASTPSSIKELEVFIKSKLSQRTNMPIVLTNTQYMWRYKDAEKNYRHYVAINGYDGADGTMHVVDPNHKKDKNGHNLGGEYWEKIGDYNMTGYGVGKAVQSAAGANPTLVW
ncbi:C39 family peptidase [Bacillus cereus]|uniref:Peptidase C39-like domain-containing protein n=1 Tax=Bacillus cereus TaxID=1396 RepID=A0A2A7HRY6_BACCE|nr:C39 family peptidase [Bacillus cereus]PEC19929.1 hypothetical protein COM96_22335 [Bacillus cereus]